MNKNTLLVILFFALAFSVSSCDGGNEAEEEITIAGEWKIVERTLTTDDLDLNEKVNNLYLLEAQNYNLKRIFDQMEPGIGSEETLTLNIEDGTIEGKRTGIYRMTKDTLYIDDQVFGATVATYMLDRNTLVTHTKLNRAQLVLLMQEIGIGLTTPIPDGMSGVLKMRESRLSFN